MRQPKLLQPSPTTETSREPIRRRSMSLIFSCNELPNIIVALDQSPFACIQICLVRAVFHFHAYRAIIACIAQHGKETAPVDIAESRKLGRVILERMGENADFIETIPVDARILQVNAENSGFKLA